MPSLIDNITYTLSPFIHVPFMQHKACDITTLNGVLSYTKSLYIGGNTLQVSYSTKFNSLPSGVYARRLLAYICKRVTKKRLDKQIIQIPLTKSEFYSKVLSINYAPNQVDRDTINQQLQAFSECLISIIHSNPNDRSRRNYKNISLLSADYDHSWLWSEHHKWQGKLTISAEFLELIKSCAVPISEKAVDTFTSAQRLDIFNYFMYQNYNLSLKNLNYKFNIHELHNLFGAGTSDINSFRKQLRKIVAEIKQISSLDITELDSGNWLLTSNEESLLKRHKRRKTNVQVDPDIAITEDMKEKFSAKHGEIEVMAAMAYLRRRVKSKQIDNPYGYLKDVLKNPAYYRKERIATIELIHKQQYAQFEQLKDGYRKRIYHDLVKQIQRTPLHVVKPELQLYLEQLKTPGRVLVRNMASFEYCQYLYWAMMMNLLTETNNTRQENRIIELFSQLFKG